jgi:hypothetical protein
MCGVWLPAHRCRRGHNPPSGMKGRTMSNFISRFFHLDSSERPPGEIDRGYVSEYTHFIDQFLVDHPEAVVDQHDGRLLYWDKKVDLADLQKAEQDHVEADGYGFYSSAWHTTKH